jgi:hypothetical protein
LFHCFYLLMIFWFRFVSVVFRFVSFRFCFILFRFCCVSFRFLSFLPVSFRFISVSFLVLQSPVFCLGHTLSLTFFLFFHGISNQEKYILNVQMLLEYCYMENGHRKLTTGILANENIIQTQSKMKLWYDKKSMDMLPLVLTVLVWFAQQFILDLAPHEVQFCSWWILVSISMRSINCIVFSLWIIMGIYSINSTELLPLS